MKISLATHGGQAAVVNLRSPPRVLDVDTLGPAQRTEIERLIAAAAAEAKKPAAADNGGIGGDLGTHVVGVEDGGRSFVLKQSDRAMPEAFAALLDRLQKHFAGK
jgi:hypothetical protein